MNLQENSFGMKNNKQVFREGVKDGIPIGLGYLAVSFSLGIMVKNAGLNAGQGFLASILCLASAGEYAGFSLIAAEASYIEVAIMMLIINARYLLMSCALSQRVKPGTSMLHRLGISYGITDEIFGITINRSGYLNPYYTYGALAIAAPLWAIGTSLGCIAGNVMPLRLVSAFSVALYGMFLAVIIPPARKDKIIAVLVIVSFAASYASTHLPIVSKISGGTRTIILTVVISAIAAVLFPKNAEEEKDEA